MGTLYLKNDRWYWRGRPPGEKKIKAIALIPANSRFATKDRKVAEFLAKKLFDKPRSAETVMNINDLCSAYQNWAQDYYGEKEPVTIKLAFRPLKEMYGTLTPDELSPKKLKLLRASLIDSKSLCRREINRRIGIIRRMYKWAVSEELVHVHVYQAIAAVEGLKRGRTKAIDHQERKPVDLESVEAILPYTTKVVEDMVRINALTGMRPDELCEIKPQDINRNADPWIYIPKGHKNSWRGQQRHIFLGPKAQKILTPYLFRDPDKHCFSPQESEKQRLDKLRAERKTPVYGKRKKRTYRQVSKSYNTCSYRRAVKYAQKAASKADVKFEPWTPYQLRHTHADMLREKAGIDVAAASLGHKDIDTTKIYAKLRDTKAAEAAQKYG